MKIKYLNALCFVLASALCLGQAELYKKMYFKIGKNSNADFQSIQKAVNSLERSSYDSATLLISSGIYTEKIIIPPQVHDLTLLGENKDNTTITFDDHSGKIDPKTHKKITTFSSYTVLIQGNDIHFKNLTIKNASCNEGQAVALHVEGNRFIAINSNIVGCQDTLLTDGDNSYQYFENCFISGTTDFIFGPATAVFKDCIIESKKNSFVTAASTPQYHKFGYVFMNCKLIATEHAKKVYLGRPWRPFAKTVFLNCQLGSHIVPEAWDPWIDPRFPDKDKTVFYAEYKNTGIGAKPEKRVSWSHQLTSKEAKSYTLKNIFENWNLKEELKKLVQISTFN